ncbi:putative ribonuclease H protein, partial [Trifolium medium]|nr:putative ribonuclease H protein [Trifolium medium]
GLRQGDPLSPYLFILCAEVFSGLQVKAQQDNQIHGISLARGAPEITRLFYADDSLIFCRVNRDEARTLVQVFDDYQRASGQLINLEKC